MLASNFTFILFQQLNIILSFFIYTVTEYTTIITGWMLELIKSVYLKKQD